MEDQGNLWKEFNLRERNPDQGGYMLYCLKYSPDRINAHHEAVVSALESIGIGLIDEGRDSIAAVLKNKLNKSESRRAYALLEELSVLNGAREYSQMGFSNVNSIEDLTNSLISHYNICLKNNHLAEAYNLADVMSPEIIRDLRLADKQNKVLSSRDKMELKQLTSFMNNQVKLLNNPGGFVMFGSKDL